MPPPVTYLSVDAVSSGVGLSQVARYVERLGHRGVSVVLHSLEVRPPDPALARRFAEAGVEWRPHQFRIAGPLGGAGRVLQCVPLVARAELVHARSDLAASTTMLARRPRWVWDMRGFWREQRVAAGMLREGSFPERVMRRVEARAARSSSAIVALSRAAAGVLRDRYGDDVADKTEVITTCADLDAFTSSPLPGGPSIRFLLAGTLSIAYDVPLMLRLVERVRSAVDAELTVLASQSSVWEDRFVAFGSPPSSVPPDEMPGAVSSHHVGLSVLDASAGVCTYAAMPTKIGEFMAAGRPVVVNAGLGDMDELVPAYDCGVVIRNGSQEEVERAADEVVRLVDDEGTPERCRKLAEEHFNLDRGVDQLLAVYERVAG